jgi:hypothetical protein
MELRQHELELAQVFGEVLGCDDAVLVVVGGAAALGADPDYFVADGVCGVLVGQYGGHTLDDEVEEEPGRTPKLRGEERNDEVGVDVVLEDNMEVEVGEDEKDIRTPLGNYDGMYWDPPQVLAENHQK